MVGIVTALLLHAVLTLNPPITVEILSAALTRWLAGLALGLLLLLPLYLLGACGAGDVKLMAMTGAFLGPQDALGAILMTFLAGGLLAALHWHLAPAGKPKPVRMPYAPAIALGTLVWLSARHAL